MFATIDYILFAGTIIVSLCIGIYFGFSKKSQTTDEYLLGGREMQVIPISVSLVASYISGLTVLGVPSDVYVYGANTVWVCLSIVIASIVGYFVFIPVILKLQGPTIFEYFELRFDRKLKVMATCMYTLQILLYSPVVAYIPAIAFSQATGINPHVIIPVVCATCVLYTCVGGFKAVIWTDVFQFLGTITSIVAVLIFGIQSVGGIGEVYKKASRGHRLDFNFSMDPTQRDGFWQMAIGFATHWIYNLTLQPAAVQKYLSLPKSGDIKRVMFFQCCGLIVVNVLAVLIGITVYAKYATCDPISTGKVTRVDQILPYFVMDISQTVPVLPGIFIGGVFSAALSTLSSTFNSLAATVYSDLVSLLISKEAKQDKEGRILKLIVITSGAICIGLTFFVDHMGSLLAFVNASIGLIYGIIVGLFALGVIAPVTNSKGAFLGALSSFLVVGTIAGLNQWHSFKGRLGNFAQPISLEGCNAHVNITTARTVLDSEKPFVLLRLSFWYNPFVSTMVVILVGLSVSYLTK
ncbi:hypothetical protein PPYR_15351, partial [Photinus pyralis]